MLFQPFIHMRRDGSYALNSRRSTLRQKHPKADVPITAMTHDLEFAPYAAATIRDRP